MRYEIIFSAHGSFIVSYCWRLSFCFVKLGCRNMNRLIEDIKIAHLAQLLIIILCTHILNTLHREMSLVSLGKPTYTYTCIKITLFWFTNIRNNDQPLTEDGLSSSHGFLYPYNLLLFVVVLSICFSVLMISVLLSSGYYYSNFACHSIMFYSYWFLWVFGYNIGEKPYSNRNHFLP